MLKTLYRAPLIVTLSVALLAACDSDSSNPRRTSAESPQPTATASATPSPTGTPTSTPTPSPTPVAPDGDGDGVPDGSDNCPNLANPNQSDSDGDGIGDACETAAPIDTDGDGVPDSTDNCLTTANPLQIDDNADGIGDACQDDTDADGVLDVDDNCPDLSNPDQTDSDNDGVGDACEAIVGGPQIKVLSNRSDLVSGNDVLIELVPPAGLNPSAIAVTLNNNDVSDQFAITADGRYMGLLTSLRLGGNNITAIANDTTDSIAITNHPQSGPVFAGPQLKPWMCRNTNDAADETCNQDPVFSWYYMPTDGDTLVSYDTANPPTDVAMTTTESGLEVPFIVRRELGYQDRDQYKVAVLYQPGMEWTARSPQPQFNGKLLITHGASCGVDYESDSAPKVISYNPLDFAGLNDPITPYITEDSAVYALSRGFAVMSTALNNSGHNCDLPLQAESMVMAKEHVIEQYGVLRYTIGAGCSGGSLAAQWVANAYPGIYQGILPTCSFPDTWSTATQFVDYHGLLLYFFGDLIFTDEYKQWAPESFQQGFDPSDFPYQPSNERTQEGWTLQSIADVMGHVTVVNAHVSEGAQFQVAVPHDRSGCGGIGASEVYNADTNPSGVRCSIVDASINVFGQRPSEDWIQPEITNGKGFAGFPLDNVGVQYGLTALQEGKITAQQFIDLNQAIGGLDIDTNFIPERTPATQPALANAYRSGMINVGTHLNRTAVIDCRGPDPGLFHDAYRAFAMRERLDKRHGNHDNHVIWGGPIPIIGDASCSLNSFKVMDDWLAAVELDDSELALSDKLTANKPAAAADACWDGAGQLSAPAACPKEVLTVYGTPRMVAGDSIATETNKCELKSVDQAISDGDYSPLGVAAIPPILTPDQLAAVKDIFPDGVCDFSKPGVSFQDTIAWMTYFDNAGSVKYGGEPLPATPANSGGGWMSENFGGF